MVRGQRAGASGVRVIKPPPLIRAQRGRDTRRADGRGARGIDDRRSLTIHDRPPHAVPFASAAAATLDHARLVPNPDPSHPPRQTRSDMAWSVAVSADADRYASSAAAWSGESASCRRVLRMSCLDVPDERERGGTRSSRVAPQTRLPQLFRPATTTLTLEAVATNAGIGAPLAPFENLTPVGVAPGVAEASP